jgi:hypothetical protein
MEGDYAFKVLDPEERIEAIMVEIRNGADPKPAWPVVSAMLNEAYADLYAKGFVECQEECDEAIDQINMVHALMESERR